MLAMFRMFAGYNAWANERIYAAAGALTDADCRADLGAFFKSVHGTLNHILVADRVWMHRFTGLGDAPSRLDAILFEHFADLKAARAAEDQRIIDYIAGLTDADLKATFSYRRMTTPETMTQPLAPALSHFFNHQTHHRGQVHALLTRLTGEAPSLDLMPFQRLSGMGMA